MVCSILVKRSVWLELSYQIIMPVQKLSGNSSSVEGWTILQDINVINDIQKAWDRIRSLMM